MPSPLPILVILATSVLLELEPQSGHSLAEIREESLAVRRKQLEKIARIARKYRVEATCHVTWDYPPPEAIVRRANEMRADLVIAECHDGKRTRPWLVHLTDWELLRLSNRPELIHKNERKWRRPTPLSSAPCGVRSMSGKNLLTGSARPTIDSISANSVDPQRTTDMLSSIAGPLGGTSWKRP